MILVYLLTNAAYSLVYFRTSQSHVELALQSNLHDHVHRRLLCDVYSVWLHRLPAQIPGNPVRSVQILFKPAHR